MPTLSQHCYNNGGGGRFPPGFQRAGQPLYAMRGSVRCWCGAQRARCGGRRRAAKTRHGDDRGARPPPAVLSDPSSVHPFRPLALPPSVPTRSLPLAPARAPPQPRFHLRAAALPLRCPRPSALPVAAAASCFSPLLSLSSPPRALSRPRCPRSLRSQASSFLFPFRCPAGSPSLGQPLLFFTRTSPFAPHGPCLLSLSLSLSRAPLLSSLRPARPVLPPSAAREHPRMVSAPPLGPLS